MSEEKLKKILSAGEGIGVEFKESHNALPENVIEAVLFSSPGQPNSKKKLSRVINVQ